MRVCYRDMAFCDIAKDNAYRMKGKSDAGQESMILEVIFELLKSSVMLTTVAAK